MGEMSTNRILYLDLVKLSAIYLVILGHVYASIIECGVVGWRMLNFIYSFHMPLFMLMSGYFVSNRTLDSSFIQLLRTKGKQLLLPAFTCTVVCCIYKFLTKEGLFYFRDEIIGTSWFLKTLFVFYVLFWLCKKTELNDWLIIIVSSLLLFITPHASSLQVNLLWPYFVGGYLLHKYEVLNKIAGTWSILLFILMFTGGYSIQQHLNVPNYFPINILTLSSNEWWKILLRYAVAFSGSMSVLMLMSLVDRYFGGKVLFDKISKYGKYTLGVYLLQNILVENMFPNTLALHVDCDFWGDVVIAPMLSIFFLVLCLWLIHILSKNKTLDMLFFGGQYYKR